MKWKAPLAGILVAASVAGVCAADWPGYMGPRRDGTSTEKGLLRTWPKQGPKVLWTVPLGAGFAGPDVSRGKVYMLDRDDKVGDILRVYNVATGKELWTFAYDALGKFEFNGSHTQPPILYKDHFYVQYTTNERSDGLVCMTLDGQVKWKTGEEPLFSKGGAVLADGLLLATDGNTKLYLIEPDPAVFKPLATADMLESANNWAPLALVDGRLLIRDQKQMTCLQVARQIKQRLSRRTGADQDGSAPALHPAGQEPVAGREWPTASAEERCRPAP